MAKAAVYLAKIERCRTMSSTGFRIKQAMYNAIRACHAQKEGFPYQTLHEKHCIPGRPDFLCDTTYYKLTDNGFVPSERTMSEREVVFRALAEKVGGKVVFTLEREPVLMVDGWLLRGGQVHEDSKFLEEFEEDFSVPYELYPRTINYSADGKQKLVEHAQGVCEWMDI